VDLFDPGFEDRTLGTILRAQAQRHGARPWLLSGDDRWTFAQADAEVDRYAAGLGARGVRSGTAVALMLENSARFVFLALALGRLGAIFIPINLAHKRDSLRHMLTQSATEFVVVERGLLPRLGEVADALPGIHTVIIAELSTARVPEALGDRALHDLDSLAATPLTGASATSLASTLDPWSMMFTSGTTGPSKGAVMTHQYWYLVPAALAGPARAVRADDVFYVSSPLFHAAAWLVQLLPALYLGLPVAIDEGFSVTQFWERTRHYGATQLLTMGATHLWLLKQPPHPDDSDNPARVWAPVPLPAELWAPVKQRFGIDHLWSTYGGTEFMSVTNTDVRRPVKPGSSGWARDSVQLAVLDELGRQLPTGEVGELCVRPTVPHAIFQGYAQMPEETLARFRDLWYHTGDLVRIDDEGELFFIDRKDDYLRVRGENVSSFEVETAFAEHPAILEAAAYRRPSEESAQVAEDEIHVCIVLQPDATADAEAFLRFAADRLPRFAVPRYLEFVADLPRTATGRVQKHLLRARPAQPQVWDRTAAGVVLER
jgi:crotonobetaine/carnitine-CoA ligase